MGFTTRYSSSEGGPTIQPFTAGAAVAVGDLVKLSSGKVIPSTTDATGVVGVVVAVPEGTIADGTTGIQVCTDKEAVYANVDANARKLGAPLDIAGTTGAMTLAAGTNKDFIVAADSSALQETLVRVNPAKHFTIDLT